jgi:hypothetical protein
MNKVALFSKMLLHSIPLLNCQPEVLATHKIQNPLDRQSGERFFQVAGPGFEPATFGLYYRTSFSYDSLAIPSA